MLFYFFEYMKKAILYLLVYLFVAQLLVPFLLIAIIVLFAYVADVPSDFLLDNAYVENAIYVLSDLVVLIYFLRRHEVKANLVNNSKPIVYLFMVLIGISYFVFCTFISGALDLKSANEEDISSLISTPIGVFDAILLAPVCEEVVFRCAILYNLFLWRRSFWFAISISAFVFAVLHFDFTGLPFYLLFGVIAGLTVMYTGGILPAVLFHISNNALCYVELHIVGDGLSLYERAGADLSWTLVAVSVIVAAWCLILLKKKTKFSEYGITEKEAC